MLDQVDSQFTRRRGIAICAVLVLMTAMVFAPAVDNEFVLYDDNDYVTANAAVKAGLTWRGLVWAFTTSFTGNWHPLTWLSHMADVEVFGLDPHGHHLVNVVFHLANTVLLFTVLRAMTGAVEIARADLQSLMDGRIGR